MQFSFFKNITTTAGAQQALSWDELVSYLTTFDERAKKDGPLYSPAIYQGDPQRMDMNVVGMSAVVLDIDNSEGTGKKARPSASPTMPEDHEDNLGEYAYIWHSTHSNDPEWPKWRLIIPLARPVPPSAWAAVFAGALEMLGQDPNIDGTSKDLSRSYYLPSCPPDMREHAFAGAHPGDVVEPEYLIELSGMPVVAGSLPDMTAKTQDLPSDRVPTPGRNNALKSIVGACLERGEAFERIVSEVLAADAKHDPPLFSDPSEQQYQYLSPEIAAIKFVSSLIVSTNRVRGRQGLPPELPHIRPEVAYAAPSVEIDATVTAPDVLPIPGHLMELPGMLGQMTDWIESCAIKPQPVLSLAAAIAACGAMMGRKVQTETGLRTNLYVVGLGETSCGKENARQRVKDLIVAAGWHELLGPEELASDSGLLRAVKQSPSLLLQIDEIGYMLRAMKHDKASSFKADIAPTLMKLESAASSVMIGRGYASTGKKGKDGTEREDIIQPCVCLYGSSVPCRFLKALTPDEIMDGFIPRMLVFESDDPNPKRRAIDVELLTPPSALVTRVQCWRDRPTAPKAGNLVPYTGADIPQPKVIRFTDQARQIFAEYEEVVRREQDKTRNRGLAGLWGKTEAIAMKLALIYACADWMDTDMIRPEAALWAVELTATLTRNMVLRAEQHISANQVEADVKKILRDISQAGAEGIGHTELYKRNRKHGTRAFRDMIAALKEQGEIVEGKIPSGTREAVRYVLKAFVKE